MEVAPRYKLLTLLTVLTLFMLSTWLTLLTWFTLLTCRAKNIKHHLYWPFGDLLCCLVGRGHHRNHNHHQVVPHKKNQTSLLSHLLKIFGIVL